MFRFGSLCLFTLAFVSGCASAEELARARAANEYDCPEDKIRTKWISSGPNGYEIYKVSACGTVATYACNDTSSSCIRESDDR